MTGLLGAVGATLYAPPPPWFVWNVSRSAPVGLYTVEGRRDLAVGDMVAARMPQAWRALAGARRYLPINVPLIKRIAAGPGDHVCAVEADILVNGEWVGSRLERDGAGQSMPWWSGCRRLRESEYFLLMRHAASFDGRYFGPTASDDIIGRVHLLWAR